MGLNAWRCVYNFTAEHLRKRFDGCLAARTDINHLALPHIRALDCEHICPDDIRDVREIAGDGDVAEYRYRLIILPRERKLSYRERVWSVRVHPRPIHVEVAQADRFDSVRLGPEFRKKLSDILLQTIRIDGIRCHRFNKR